MSYSGQPPSGSAGILGSIKALGGTLLALVSARLELAVIELQEGRERYKELFVLAVVAAIFCALGLLLAALFIVVLFWDTYRLPAIGGVTVLYLGAGMWALYKLNRGLREMPPLFSATLREFEEDMEALRSDDE